MRRILILGVVASAAALGWLAWTQTRARPLVVSGLIEADVIRVGSRVGGRVSEVLVREGDSVDPGDALYQLSPFDLDAQQARAEALLAARRAEHDRLVSGFRVEEIEQARAVRNGSDAVLKRLEAGPREREIEVARQKLNVALADLELAESEYERVVRLRESGQAGKIEFDQVVRARKAAQAERDAAAQELALLEEGTRSEEIAQARAALAAAEQALQLRQAGFRREEIARAAADVAAAEAELEIIRARIDELTVSSPCPCVVETIELRPGDLVAPDAPTVSLLDRSSLWVRAYVPESRLGQVRLGQLVPVRVDSFPEQRFAGRVTLIARQAEFTPRNVQTPEERSKQVFRIKVTLEEGLESLRVGMSADVLLDEAARP